MAEAIEAAAASVTWTISGGVRSRQTRRVITLLSPAACTRRVEGQNNTFSHGTRGKPPSLTCLATSKRSPDTLRRRNSRARKF